MNVQDKKIRVVGHSDNKPIVWYYRSKFPSNWELSAARAASVVRLSHVGRPCSLRATAKVAKMQKLARRFGW